MNEQLEQAITKLIEKALNGIDAAGDFMAGEIPEVVNQLLVWHAVESFIWFAAFATLSAIFLIGRGGAISKLLKQKEDGEPWTKCNWSSSVASPEFSMLIVYNCYCRPIFAALSAGMAIASSDWLKIIIAPKLYLLEYAASIVR